jgi:hypothetical protein
MMDERPEHLVEPIQRAGSGHEPGQLWDEAIQSSKPILNWKAVEPEKDSPGRPCGQAFRNWRAMEHVPNRASDAARPPR